MDQLPLLQGIQVLEVWVPDVEGAGYIGRPVQLVQQLSCLPRLVHLHINCMGRPWELLKLGELRGLKTLAVDYTGPPRLPKHVLEDLTKALPCCKVQLWETLNFTAGPAGGRRVNFGAGGAHGGAGWQEDEEGRGGVWDALVVAGKWGLGMIATAAVGYWTGRWCAGKVGKQRR
jgi:hypothetical protein